MRLLAKPYQNAIASAVQTMAERKNTFGRGKNETNIVCIQSQIRAFAVPLSDITYCRAYGARQRRVAHSPSVLLLTTKRRQRAASSHWPDRARRWVYARRHRSSETRQGRCGTGA